MALKGFTDSLACHIPEPHSIVSTTADNALAIRAKAYRPDRIRMALERRADSLAR